MFLKQGTKSTSLKGNDCKVELNKTKELLFIQRHDGDFLGSPVVKTPSSNAGDVGLIPGWGTKIL